MDELLTRVRAISMPFPEAAERLSGPHAQYSVRGRTFVYYMDDHHGDGMRTVQRKTPAGAQAVLIEADPARFFVPPYIGHRGWVGIRVDIDEVDWVEIAALIDQSYRLIAPKVLVKQLG